MRDLALLEEASALVCATVSVSGTVSYDSNASPAPLNPGTCLIKQGKLAKSVPFVPRAVVLAANRYLRMTGILSRLRAALFFSLLLYTTAPAPHVRGIDKGDTASCASLP